MNKILSVFFLISVAVLVGTYANKAEAASVSFGSEGKLFAPNCFCKEDVRPYNLAPWCSAKNSCNGSTSTQSLNVADGNYKVKVNLGSLTDSQKYEVVIISINGKNYTIADQGGNSSSTGTASYNLGTLHLSGNVTFKAKHKYSDIFTGKWYDSEASRIGSGHAMESISIDSIVLDKVEPPVAPKPTCTLGANPTSIVNGKSSTLTWSSTNATSASINQGIGNISIQGTRSVSPTNTTNYTATFIGAGGTATCSATVTVTQPPVIPKPTCSLSANPTTINSGSTSTLTWSSTNAGTLSLNQGIGNAALEGSRSVSPNRTTTYIATVVGKGGTVTCSATVRVNLLSPSINIEKDDNDNSDDSQSLVANGTATFKITVTNNGNANLRDVIITDEDAPNCARTATQTRGLYSGDYFDPGETFNYTCNDTNVTASYVNTANVRATVQNGSQNVNDRDTSRVNISNTPTPPEEPKEPEKPKEKCNGTIGNYIWLDANNDGVQDKSEKGLSGISIKLKKDNGKLVDKETTNKKGEYEFDDLCEGKYTVYVNDEDVSGYIQTYDPDEKKNNQTDVKLEGSHDSHTKADFGYNKTRVTPATGPGAIALYLAGLISIIILLSYKQLKQKLAPSLEEQFKRLAK